MKSIAPKVLQPIAGRPMLARRRRGARVAGRDPRRLRPRRRCGAFRSPTSRICSGPNRRDAGTGHAVRQAMPGVPDGAQVLVLYGDVPLIGPARSAPARRAGAARGAGRRPRRPGRLRPRRARCRRPGRTASSEEGRGRAQKRIRTINTGIIAAESTALKRWLDALSNDNAQGEVLPHRRVRAGRGRVQPRRNGARKPIRWKPRARTIRGSFARLERAFQRRQARRSCLMPGCASPIRRGSTSRAATCAPGATSGSTPA